MNAASASRPSAPAAACASGAARLGRRDIACALGLFALALALRVGVVLAFGAAPTWDGQFYHRGALSIAEGNGYSEPALIGGQPGRLPWSHYPVGYSAFIGAAYALFGAGPSTALLANAVVGALTAALAFLFAFDLLGRPRARVAGALVALHPGLSLYCALVMTEPLAGFLVLLAGYLARRLDQRRFGAVAAGVALAASAYVRPQSLLTLPLLVLLFRGSFGRRLLRCAVAGATCLLLIAPWTVRNCARLDGCALISTNGGWNLAIGALSDSGRFRPLTPEDGCAGLDGPVAQDRCWGALGWAAIQRDPWRWLSHIPDKLRHTYNHESFAVAYLAEAKPSEWERDHTWHVMNVMTGLHHALMFAAALGTVARFSRRRWREQWGPPLLLLGLVVSAACALSFPERPLFWIGVAIPLLGLLRLPGAPPINDGLRYLFGLLAITSLTHMVFFGDDRYHLAISPVFCILAAAALRRAQPASAVASAELGLRGAEAAAE
ncbi:MAG TPA: glycosyltransferase family 39 protein [Polyangiaceae bacterium]|nr:glycosyltransferase family 39 protein [Polyangiaceae bacterium]